MARTHSPSRGTRDKLNKTRHDRSDSNLGTWLVTCSIYLAIRRVFQMMTFELWREWVCLPLGYKNFPLGLLWSRGAFRKPRCDIWHSPILFGQWRKRIPLLESLAGSIKVWWDAIFLWWQGKETTFLKIWVDVHFRCENLLLQTSLYTKRRENHVCAQNRLMNTKPFSLSWSSKQ